MSNKDKHKNQKNIPEGYFENFEENLKIRMFSEEEDLMKEAPVLFSLGKDLGYKTPEGYFSAFKATRRKEIVRLKFGSWALGIAASFALLIMAVIITPNAMPIEENYFAAVNDDELYEYILSNAAEYTDESFLDFSTAENNYLSIDDSTLDYLLENASDFDLMDLQEL